MSEPSMEKEIDQYTGATLPTSILAIVSMISGILSYTGFPLIGAIVALITGYMARSETRSIPPRASGDNMATAGIVLGWVHFGLWIAVLLCVGASILLTFGLFVNFRQ